MRATTVVVLSACVSAPCAVHAQSFTDVLVQAPRLAKPERGSLVGSLSSIGFGASQLARGSFSLPSPMTVPGERAQLPVEILPSYSVEQGLSEWGMGWGVTLSIRRDSITGDVDYTGDEYASPWGPLVHATDGDYYPRGLREPVRLTRTAAGWTAHRDDGTVLTFGYTVVNAAGEYAWYLTGVTTALDETSSLSWMPNESGRPFLQSVTYGSATHPDTYRIRLLYELVPQTAVDYRSGAALELDRRVAQIDMDVRAADTGAYALRWRYDLSYAEAPFGPAFYLAAVVKTYASGATEPAVTYAYDLGEELLDSTDFQHLAGLDAYLEDAGPSALSPKSVATTDADDDGRVDLEHAYAQVLVRHTDAGWIYEMPPPMPPDVDARCRPSPSAYNTPRTLARMHPDDPEPRVFATQYDTMHHRTTLVVCSREGRTLHEQTIDGRWTLDANTRLTDVNRDNRPDLVAVWNDGAGLRRQIVENVSGPASYGFTLHPGDPLTMPPGLGSVSPTGTWVDDANGDAISDLVVRYSGGVLVFPGTGWFRYATGRVLALVTLSGTPVTNLTGYGFYQVDFNKDGLFDVLLTQSQSAHLFVNEGTHLRQVHVPALEATSLDRANPVLADMRGNGNAEVCYTGANLAYTLALNAPGTGLLASADDGKGTVVSFGYGRAPAWEGMGSRPVVLARMTVASAGEPPVTSDYDYEAPVLHSARRTLVGFGVARRWDAVIIEEVHFHNDDDVSGAVLESVLADARTPSIYHLERNEYSQREDLGVRWLRLDEREQGYFDAGGTSESSERVVYETYDRMICPVAVRYENAHGTARFESTLASPAGLAGAMHCLSGFERLVGTHADASLDFVMSRTIVRNPRGQVTSVTSHGATDRVLQTVEYDAYHRVKSVAAPGRGLTTIAYGAAGRILEIRGPDGVLVRATDRDGITDALETLLEERGPGATLETFGRFDGRERLTAQWMSFGGSSASLPLRRWSYEEPTSSAPGRTTIDELIDQEGRYAESTVWTRPDGSPFASGRRIPAGWSIGSLTTRDRNSRTSRGYRAPVLTDPTGHATYAQLLSGAEELTVQKQAGLGHVSHASELLQTNVTRVRSEELMLDGGAVVTESTEAGVHVEKIARDAAGRIVWTEDEAQNRTRFVRDALGRVTGVVLADGTWRTRRFDDHGDLAELATSDGVQIHYGYDPVSGLLTSRRYTSPDASLERIETIEYDAIGRRTVERYLLPATGAERVFTYAYDGDTGSAPAIPGQLGRLTSVEGPDFSRRTIFDPTGAPVSTRTTIASWLRVDDERTHYAGGAVATTTVTVTRLADGAVIDRIVKTERHDDWGRLSEVLLDGVAFATLQYDAEGRLDRVLFADGGELVYSFDPTTHRRTGYAHHTAGWDAIQGWALDARGLVSAETITIDGDSWLRDYDYDTRGNLVAVSSITATATYSYGPTGLPLAATDHLGARNLDRAGAAVLQAGGVTYVYDAFGRVRQRDALTMSYGPQGHIAGATRGADVFDFAYSETGQRILKRVNGQIDAAYVAGGHLTDAGLVLPVKIGGRVVGLIEAGTFVPVATDARGSVIANGDGTPRLLTPFGVRNGRPDRSTVLDYLKNGYDADLDVVRMGVRDYDPRLGQFWTPDPLYLSDLDRCAKSAIDCNLYSFARNDPLAYSDPSGLDPKKNEELETVETIGETIDLVGDIGAFGLESMADSRVRWSAMQGIRLAQLNPRYWARLTDDVRSQLTVPLKSAETAGAILDSKVLLFLDVTVFKKVDVFLAARDTYRFGRDFGAVLENPSVLRLGAAVESGASLGASAVGIWGWWNPYAAALSTGYGVGSIIDSQLHVSDRISSGVYDVLPWPNFTVAPSRQYMRVLRMRHERSSHQKPLSRTQIDISK